MRILQLRFRNLNSLAGEWKIDFENPAYTSDGIFAITGPTGSGKSTILDAICLGLYGRTPRLNRVNQSENEIMARQTGDCFAEVVFSTPEGRYRSCWSQKRAGSKPDGNLQPPAHELSSEASGTPLATGLRQVADGIVQVTGMDFEHFTRAMLLAQGRFAEFLQANASIRADLLEKITGTDLYSAISIYVHNRVKEEDTQLKLIEAEISGIEVLDEETETRLRCEIEGALKKKERLTLDASQNQESINWLRAIESLHAEILGLEQESMNLAVEVNTFTPEQNRLDQAQKAATLEPAFATLMEIRNRQTEDRIALASERAALPQQEESLELHVATLTARQKAKGEAKQAQEAMQPVILKTRQIDQKLSGVSQQIEDAHQEYLRDKEKTEELTTQSVEEAKKRQQAESDLESVESYIKTHISDEWLVSGLGGIRIMIGNIDEKHQEIRSLETQLGVTTELHHEARHLTLINQELLAQSQQELDDSATLMNAQSEALDQLLAGKLLREHRAEKDNLIQKKSFLEKIAELEEQRRQLQDGHPCPLCGSLDHPYAEGNVPEPSLIDQDIQALAVLITKAESLEQLIATLKEKHLGIQQKLNLAAQTLGNALKDEESTAKHLAQLQDDLSKRRELFDDLNAKLQADLAQLASPEILNLDPMALLETLNLRLQCWNDNQQARTAITERIAAHATELARLKAILATLSEGLIVKATKLKSLTDQGSLLAVERQNLFGDRIPDQEEHRLNETIKECESREMKAREVHDKQRDIVTTIKAKVKTLEMRIDETEPRRLEEETAFITKLGPAGFVDESDFLSARISGPDLEALAARSKSIKERSADLTTRLKDRKERHKAECDRNITPDPLASLETRSTELREQIEGLTTTIAQNQLLLARDEANKETVKNTVIRIDQQREICVRWRNLDRLVGSSNGNQYRNFVQGLTFEIMVSHANRQLRRMTDRYILIPDGKEALELNVLDNYQAGEKRSTKNLSGGESFIVSLALALGLSKMASKNVRVDSLFLDEGFGTLDEDALETALDTLAGLQQEGKLIGVISHVQALKDRISTQIQVESGNGGRSTISGPGVSTR